MFNIDKKRLIVIAAIIAGVLIVGGVALGVAVWQSDKNLKDTEKTTKKPVTQYKSDQQQKLVEDVNKKYGTGDYKGAIALIEGQQNTEDVNTQLLLAGAYANSRDFNKALEIYKKIDSTGKLPGPSIQNMASIATEAKDYKLAIDLYKRAKTYMLSSNERNNDQIAFYDYQIAELGKKL